MTDDGSAAFTSNPKRPEFASDSINNGGKVAAWTLASDGRERLRFIEIQSRRAAILTQTPLQSNFDFKLHPAR